MVLCRTKGTSRIENINCFLTRESRIVDFVLQLDQRGINCLMAGSVTERTQHITHSDRCRRCASFAAFVPRTQEHMVDVRATAFALKWSRGGRSVEMTKVSFPGAEK